MNLNLVSVKLNSALDYLVLVLFAFVVSDLLRSVLRQEIGYEERPPQLPIRILCRVGRNTLTQSISQLHKRFPSVH